MEPVSARVLLVEDEESLAGALADGPTAHGFDVAVALDGADGLRLARNHRFDLIVLDPVGTWPSGTTPRPWRR